MGHGSVRRTGSEGTRTKSWAFFFVTTAAPLTGMPLASTGPASSSYSLLAIHSRSSTYQLRFCPRFSASSILAFVLKCQSRCLDFFSFPTSSNVNLFPHVLHWFGRALRKIEINCGRDILIAADVKLTSTPVSVAKPPKAGNGGVRPWGGVEVADNSPDARSCAMNGFSEAGGGTIEAG